MKKGGSTPIGNKVSTNEEIPWRGADTDLPLEIVDQRTRLTLPLGRKSAVVCGEGVKAISTRFAE